MSDGAHLLIPFASAAAEGCIQALRGLPLPQLEKLLARLAPGGREDGNELTASMPHERALARACGLPAQDGRVPLAAWQLRQAGREDGGAAWAWITPCHWRVGTDHVAMGDPPQLQLSAGDSQALLAAMLPFFQEDGIALEYDTPTRWLARGETFRDLQTASLDRVVGRTLDPWMPRTPQAATLRRLQQEMQMLLYTHEVNEQRGLAGLLPVNSFWASGAGALPPSAPAAPPAGLHVANTLRDSALQSDWPAWAAAWQELDSSDCARLVQAHGDGQPVILTLCGERSAQTWAGAAGNGMLRRLGGLFARKQAAAQLETL
ncbi:MAG: hypothetical protein JWQ07_2364 [Ramlibacter sp.]|nr:hypothetical protein [Ramlibacter sp.]